jgi:Flp pilus assembly protein TadG
VFRSNLCDRSVAGRAPHRRGALTVEFALTVPLVFLLLFGAIELLYVNMVRCSAEAAAYDGARRAVVPGATADDARAAAQFVLDTISIRGEQVTVSPDPITDSADEVTVTIEIPLDSNSLVSPRYAKGRTLRRSCTLQREMLEISSAP